MKSCVKKNVLLTIVLLCASVFFASCGGGSGGAARADSASSAEESWNYSPEYAAEDVGSEDMGYSNDMSYPVSREISAVVSTGPGDASRSERIIYSADANIETAEFDAAIEGVYAMIDEYGAFIETSYVGGRGYADTYTGRKSYRSANFAIRVPKERFTAMTDSLSDIGSLLSFSSNALNISSQYVDTESRLNAYRTEETRLLEMLASVNDVESLIALESRLSDVRYEIESLTSRLRDWQDQVDYSTVNLYIDEVDRLQEQTRVDRSYAQELGDGFTGTLRGVGTFFMELFKLVVAALPVLVILAVLALAAFFIVKRTRACGRARTEKLREERGADKQIPS
jgi:hypothetical protein